MIGAIAGGFLNEKFYQKVDLIMSINLAIMAGGCFVLPWSTSVPMAAGAFAINGFSEGIINTAGNTMVMDLWLEKAATPMHSLHFGFGFGAMLAPQIARPFISSNADDSLGASWENFTTIENPKDSEARIAIPYGIVGIFILAFSLVVLAFQIKGQPKDFPVRQNNTSFKAMVNPGSCTNGHVLYSIALFSCLFFYFIQAVGGERAYGKFLFSYATEDNYMTTDEAANLQTLFWFSFTFGRFLGIPLTKFLPLDVVIIGDVIGCIITSSVLALYAYDSPTVLWACTPFMGMFIGVVFPNGMSWANLKMNMNSVAVMVLMMGVSTGGFIYQYTTGYLFENEGAETLMYVMFTFSILLMFSYIAMTLVAHFCKPNEYEVHSQPDVEIMTISGSDIKQ